MRSRQWGWWWSWMRRSRRRMEVVSFPWVVRHLWEHGGGSYGKHEEEEVVFEELPVDVFGGVRITGV